MNLIIENLTNSNMSISIPALRIAGNISSSKDETTVDILLFNGVLEKLQIVLSRSKRINLKKETLWCLSNITAGTNQQVQSFMSDEKLVHTVIK